MAGLSLRLDDRDSELIKKYAELKHVTISKLVRDAVIAQIEDEIDIDLFDKALKNTTKTYTLDEVKRALGL